MSTTLPPGYQADFIIVGGGAAGCVIAARLSEYFPKKQVLLIEAGPSDVGNAAVEEVRDWWYLLKGNFPFIRDYPIVGREDLTQPRAIILGGCTSHNTSLSFRTFTKDIVRWQEEGVGGSWTVETFTRCLDNLPTRIERIQPDESNNLFKDWVEGCKNALGVEEIVDFNERIREQGGFGNAVGYFSVAYDPQTGDRCSASVAYIHPLIQEGQERPNLKVLLEATVTHIQLSEVHVGIEKPVQDIEVVLSNGTKQRIHATNEVILCAGSIDTPQLLLLSGIGPRDKYEHLGIPCQQEIPGIGENLQDHPEGSIFWSLKEPAPYETVVYSDAGLFLDRTGEGADIMVHSYQTPVRVWLQPGLPMPPPDTTAPVTTIAAAPDTAAPLLSSPHVKSIGDSQFKATTRYAPYAPLVTESHFKNLLDKKGEKFMGGAIGAFAMQPNTPNPRSRGFMTLETSNPSDYPILDFKYFSDPENYDLTTLVYAIERAREVAQAPPFSNWIDEEVFPGAEVTDPVELGEAIRGASTNVYHPIGTTKMGDLDNDPMAVVDYRNMKVKGIKGLRCCDAGVIPTLTTINPMLTILAIAEHGAELIASDYGWVIPV